jgi:hypothetical protein
MNFKKPSYRIASIVRPVRTVVLKNSTRTTIVQAKPSLKAERIRYLKGLVYETFTGDLVPEGHRNRFDIYDAAKETVRELGAAGWPAYEHAVNACKHAWVSQEDWLDAVSTVIRK